MKKLLAIMITMGSVLAARAEIHTELTGPNATAHLNAAQLLIGTQHADITTVVRHAAPHGTSRQTVKHVLAGRSRGVFQGRIEVARHAQKTGVFLDQRENYLAAARYAKGSAIDCFTCT